MSRRVLGLVLALTGVLAALGVAVACSGGGGGMDNPAAPPAPVMATVVEIHDNFFDPRSITVQPGQTVRWELHSDMKDHTVTAVNGAFDSGATLDHRNEVFQHTFGASDDGKTFNYFCQTHRDCCNMKGSVRVGASAPPPDPGY